LIFADNILASEICHLHSNSHDLGIEMSPVGDSEAITCLHMLCFSLRLSRLEAFLFSSVMFVYTCKLRNQGCMSFLLRFC
jgi:hypothetical protein